MYRPRIIPVLLLKESGLVKTTKFKKYNYIGDPINAVKIFNDLEADELIFLDISATNENRTIDYDFIKEIGDEAFMPFSIGGGITNINQVESLISQGAEKVVLNSYCFKNPSIITEIANLFGSQSVVVSIDIFKNIFGKYSLYSHSGKKKQSIKIIDWIKRVVDLGAGEILINSVNNDGIMEGYDLDLISMISKNVNIPVIACGGAGCYNDFHSAITSGAHAVAAGSLFVYHGPKKAVLINYPSKKEISKIKFYE